MEKLRKVKFTLEHFNGTIGDYESAGVSAEEIMKQRDGLFHTWGNECYWDSEKGTYQNCTVAIVEEIGTGKVYQVCPRFMRFVQEEKNN